MNKSVDLEYLCPHCLVSNSYSHAENEQQNTEIKVRCSSCFSQFEIIVAEGINGKRNAVVSD